MTSQVTTRGDVLQRIGGVGLIIGGVLTIVANLLVPRPDDPSSVASQVATWAADPDRTRIGVFGVILGLWALVTGFAAVYRSITSGAGSAWARLGFYGIIVSTAVFSIAGGVALAGVKAAAAGTDDIARSLAAAGDSLFGISILAYWTALLFLGIGIAASTAYPKWIGWVLIIAGAVTALAGSMPRIFADPTTTTELVFGAGAVVSSVMALVLGLLITRREMKSM